MPNFFFTNITSTKYIYVNIKNLKSIYILLEHKINIFLTTYFDILEGIIPLCKSNITKCLYINIRHINNIHEIYKLRKKLINELLIPKKTLQNLYTRIKNDNKGFIIGIHIRTAIYSDFKENDYRFYNNETEHLYFHAIQNVLQKYKKKRKKLYIISDSTKIKYKFMKKYNKFVIIDMNLYNEKISHNINDLSIKEQFVLSNCNVIIGSCASTFTLLSVFRNLNDYYAIQGVNKGSCGYALDNKHLLFFNTKEI